MTAVKGFGHMRPVYMEKLDFLFVITVTLIMKFNRIKIYLRFISLFLCLCNLEFSLYTDISFI